MNSDIARCTLQLKWLIKMTHILFSVVELTDFDLKKQDKLKQVKLNV